MTGKMAIRQHQLDVYTRTSSLTKGIKAQTEGLILTAQAAAALACRIARCLAATVLDTLRNWMASSRRLPDMVMEINSSLTKGIKAQTEGLILTAQAAAALARRFDEPSPPLIDVAG
jgi:hypothetical protein